MKSAVKNNENLIYTYSYFLIYAKKRDCLGANHQSNLDFGNFHNDTCSSEKQGCDMNKKGYEITSVAVAAIAAVIALVVFLFIFPEFGEKLYAAGSKGECEWSVLVSALTRTPGLGFENIPVECRAKYKNVTMADLQANYPSAEKMMQFYKTKGQNYAAISNLFSDPVNPLMRAEWSMNKIVADEMVECWDKVWHGEMPLFDSWYRLIDYQNVVLDPATVANATQQNISVTPGAMTSLDYLKVWNLKFQRPPVFCIVCTRLKLTDDVKSQFAAKPDIKSLTLWMQFNAVPGTSESYYLYTLPDWLKPFQQNYGYNVNQPIAVVYSRINMHKIATVTSPIVTFLGLGSSADAQDKADKIVVVPYDSVILPFNKNGANCDYVLD